MFRVGKPGMAAALALPGVARAEMGGRPMGGFVEAGAADLAADGLTARLLAMAIDFVSGLPREQARKNSMQMYTEFAPGPDLG